MDNPKHIEFRCTTRFGVTTFWFNKYKYEVEDIFVAKQIKDKAIHRPGKAWNMAKEYCSD